MRNILLSTLAAAAVAALPKAQAQDEIRNAADALQPMGEENYNRFGLSYRMGFNMTASFNHIGGYGLPNRLTPQPDRLPYNYDNGYIYPDASQHGAYTWFYGYDLGTSVGQGNFTLYNATSAADLSTSGNDGDPQHGLDLTYFRRIGKAGRGFWGLCAGVGFTDVAIKDRQTLQGAVQLQADTFQNPANATLGGSANWNSMGDPNNPGIPLVGLAPSVSTLAGYPNMETVIGQRELDASIVDFRVGPYLDMPMGNRWMFTLNGGLALLLVNSDFKFSETVTIDSSITPNLTLPAETHTGSGSKTDLLVGGFVGGNFSYAVNDRLRLFAGAYFQAAQDSRHSESGKEAVLRLGETVFASFGASFSF